MFTLGPAERVGELWWRTDVTWVSLVFRHEDAGFAELEDDGDMGVGVGMPSTADSNRLVTARLRSVIEWSRVALACGAKPQRACAGDVVGAGDRA